MKRKPSAARRLGTLTSELYSAIYHMTPRQRRAAKRALLGLTSTNCGWTLYALRVPLLEFLAMATPLRNRKGPKS